MKILCLTIFIACKCLAQEQPEADVQANVVAQPNENIGASGMNAASAAVAPAPLLHPVIPVPPQIVKPSNLKTNFFNFFTKFC